MIQVFKRQNHVLWRDWAMEVGLIAGMGVFGIVLYQIILTLAKSARDAYVPLGTILAGFTATIFVFALIMTQFSIYFNIQISMGCTRKRFFVSFFAGSLFWSLAGYVTVLLVCLAENALNGSLHPQIPVKVNVFPYILRWGAPVMLLLTAVSVLLGAVLLRFGRRAYWIMFALWMILCIGFPRVMEAVDEAPDSVFGKLGNGIIDFVLSVPAGTWGIVMAAAVAAGLAGAYVLIRRQQVTM